MSLSPASKPDGEEVIAQAYATYMQALIASGRVPANLPGPEQERMLTRTFRHMAGVTGFESAAAMSRT